MNQFFVLERLDALFRPVGVKVQHIRLHDAADLAEVPSSVFEVFDAKLGKDKILPNHVGLRRRKDHTLDLACCRFRGHEDKIVTMELEIGYDETKVQPRVQDRGSKADGVDAAT